MAAHPARNTSGVDYDLLVIGGGVNGTGIARDAAGRGLDVFLAEMNDLASGTSSAATKLVHGGLRYLEHYEFRLVRESLIEREVLWASAPHIIHPLRFVLPHHKGLRPWPVLRAGLFAYDHLGGRRLLPATRTLDLRRDPAGAPLRAQYRAGFEYSDCFVDDARLVALNAVDAAERGAVIATRTRLVSARRDGGRWRATLRDQLGGDTYEVGARLLVNAAGPWIDTVLASLGTPAPHNVRLVKGSHIVVPRLYDHDRAYIFQNADGRVVFAIPYEGDFTLIGTTDIDFAGDPAAAAITPAETVYLCGVASEYFDRSAAPQDVVWSYAGVRPLYDDGASAAQEATRDYVLRLEQEGAEAPLINVFGGKLTTYRRLSEQVANQAQAVLGKGSGAWTRAAHLPGGDFEATGFEAAVGALARAYPALPPALLRRLTRHYGTRASLVLGRARDMADLGTCFGADLTAAEVDYLVTQEWALSAEDVLFRRTKMGLHLTTRERGAVGAHIEALLSREQHA